MLTIDGESIEFTDEVLSSIGVKSSEINEMLTSDYLGESNSLPE
ncbi:MAG: hypothetical protein ACI9SP_000587 [Arenicella sp.]|jgi:hypothetical protein